MILHVLRARTARLLAFLVILGASLYAGDSPFDSLHIGDRPGPAVQIPTNAVIGSISFTRLNVFDAQDSAWPYRMANRLHIVTDEDVISSFLLFEKGSVLDQESLRESERILRRLPYVYDARVFPSAVDGNSVDLNVVTRDVWSLEPLASFARQGGESSILIGIRDFNVLGTGKSIIAKYTDNVDRESYILGYGDPNLFGSRFVLSAQLGDSSDGDHVVAVLQRPFYSLDSKWTAGVQYSDVLLTKKVFSESVEVNRFDHVADTLTLFGGLSAGLTDGKATRWRCGFTYRKDTFQDAVAGDDTLPENRTLAYPWIEVSRIRDRYSKRNNINFMHLTEDVNLGPQSTLRFGWSSPTWGARDDDLVCYALHAHGFSPGEGHLLMTELAASAYWKIADDLLWDTVLNATARYYLQTSKRSGYYASAAYRVAQNLSLDKQIVLGGENGMRGYPLRYQNGDRRFVMTLEKRHFTGWDLARIFRIGAVAFADLGMAWNGGEGDESRVLSDVGFGIRLSPTRAYVRNIIHLDIAAPLTDADELDAVQFSFTVESRF